MKKFIKSTVAVASAMTMAFTMASVPVMSTLADDAEPTVEPEKFVTWEMADDEVHYILAGSFGKVAWEPLAKDNEMTPVEGMDGVYSYTAELPENEGEGEEKVYQSEFKICKITNSVGSGWDASLCVGTNVYADNQSQIKVLNENAGTYTVYLDTNTGAVIVKSGDDVVDIQIKWVGFGDEAPFMAPEEIAKTTVADWPAGKVMVDEIPDVAAINKAFADKVNKFYNYVPWEMGDEVAYTVAGGFGSATWKPLSRANTMTATSWANVYSFTAELPAYSEETEWQNRFKVCRINDTVGSGWDGSLCVGTNVYSDNQSQIRILNEEAGTFTIYCDTKTGAVVVKDAAGKLIDLSISWVGYDNETQFMTPEEIAKTTVADWPEDKVKVDAIPDVAAINAALVQKLSVQNTLKLSCSTKTIYTGKAGNTVKVKATVTGSSKKVTWKSSKTSVATISGSGTTVTVKAKKAGTTVISAKANGITKKITIKVKNPSITVKKGSKKVSSISLKKGKSATLKVTTSPAKSGVKAAYATTSSKKVIKISTKSDKVTVKAIKKGTAKIKITSGGASKTVTVKVK
ncbi:MAG: hypothetical protein HDT39_16755 [Lachnospiraceae bacterium]|nr:hypothetical protein [Lachnospiraceae bacterium]